MAEHPIDPTIRKRLIVGTLLILGSIGFLVYHLRWVRSAFQGPVSITLASLQKLEDPSSLPNPWISLTFDQAIDTGFGMEQTKSGKTTLRSKYLLVQVGDHWLLTDVPVNFSGNTVVGYLDTWWSPLSKKVVKEIQAEFTECDTLPYQLNAEYSYRSQCFSLLGLIAIFLMMGCWIIAKALNDRRKTVSLVST